MRGDGAGSTARGAGADSARGAGVTSGRAGGGAESYRLGGGNTAPGLSCANSVAGKAAAIAQASQGRQIGLTGQGMNYPLVDARKKAAGIIADWPSGPRRNPEHSVRLQDQPPLPGGGEELLDGAHHRLHVGRSHIEMRHQADVMATAQQHVALA